MASHRVVVVGSGFAGLQLVLDLKGAPVDITLVDRRNHHLFQPLLYQVATGILSAGDIAWLDAYHARVRAELSPLLDGGDLDWLVSATRPLAARAPA